VRCLHGTPQHPAACAACAPTSGTLFVNREGVEVRNIDKGVRGAQDAPAGPASSANWCVRRNSASSTRLTPREFISAENSLSRKTVNPLFQAELKPVPAGDTVSRVVMKVLVGHHRLDALKTRYQW
jgi:hypothetical protein